MRIWPALAGLLILAGCSPNPGKVQELHIAAASNLIRIVPAISAAFERETRVHVVASYGSTAQLTRQIENGAPLDVFLAADTQDVEELVRQHHAVADSRMIYARGRLAVWAPRRPELHALTDLPSATTIAIAKPELAPYGQAAIEALQSARLWDKLEKKIVYAPSIMAAKQLADTGNADAAFIATSLITGQQGNSFPVNPALHQPILQAACITTQAQDPVIARRFLAFLASEPMRTLFRRYGYVAE